MTDKDFHYSRQTDAVFQYWILGCLVDHSVMVWWLNCARAQKRRNSTGWKEKKWKCRSAIKDQQSAAIWDTPYQQCHRLWTLASVWKSQVHACCPNVIPTGMRKCSPVWDRELPSGFLEKPRRAHFFPSPMRLCGGWHRGQFNSIQQHLWAQGVTGATKNREGRRRQEFWYTEYSP